MLLYKTLGIDVSKSHLRSLSFRRYFDLLVIDQRYIFVGILLIHNGLIQTLKVIIGNNATLISIRVSLVINRKSFLKIEDL